VIYNKIKRCQLCDMATREKEPYISVKKPYTCANEPYLSVKKCCIIRSINACVCDVTHLCVWHDSLCVIWLIHMCDVTRSYESVTTHSCAWCDSFVCVAWLIRICDMTNSYVWHDSFMRVTWLFFFGCVWYEWQDVCSCVCYVIRSYVWHIQDEWVMSHTLCLHDGVTNSVYAWHCSLICDIWHKWHDPLCDMTLLYMMMIWRMCDPTYSYMIHAVWHDSLICVTWLIDLWNVCDMTHSYVIRVPRRVSVRDVTRSLVWHMHSYVWHDSLMGVTWLIYMCDMTHSFCVWYECKDMFMCVTWLIRVCSMTRLHGVTRLIHMCDITHSYQWHDSCICETRRVHMFYTSVHMCHVWHGLSVCAWHGSLICDVCDDICDMTHYVTWLTHLRQMCDMTNSYVMWDGFI